MKAKNIVIILPLSLLAILLSSPSTIHPNASKKENNVELIIPDSGKFDPGWGSGREDFRNLEILNQVDEASSQRKLKESARDYRIAVDIFQNAESTIETKKEEYALEVNPEDRYEWQKAAREEKRNRELAKIQYEGRSQATQYLIKGMNSLDKIDNPKVKSSETYLELKAGLYREYSKHQFALKNYIPTTDILSRYIELDDKYYNESEPHKILAFCYEKLEQSANKNRKIVIADEFREKKKRHLLTYAELHYGKESAEFQRIVEKVQKDY
jgi:hypothetical protein